MKRIHLLNQQLANQIAAGEVVERPASVIKELVENAIDAGSDQISITVANGGVGLIRVRDNGSGIEKDDLPLALARHATSKISSLNELVDLQSLGFRGEALASISSVAELTLSSCVSNQGTAWQVHAKGREMQATVKPCAHPVGTTVEVHDLFYNTPARRKFLKSARTELALIEGMVKRLALSQFQIAWRFIHEDKVVFNLPQAATEAAQHKRIGKIMGQNFLKQAVKIDVERQGLRLWGWLGDPSLTRSQSDRQYFYVNGRLIRDKLILHALKEVYEVHLTPGRYPLYLLNLELAPNLVDVNVHPTKHEVRFQEARRVHDFLRYALSKAVNSESISSLEPIQIQQSHRYDQTAFASTPQACTFPSTVSVPSVQSEPSKTLPGKLHGVVGDHFLLLEQDKGLLLIDMNESYRQIIMRELAQKVKKAQCSSVPLLLPAIIELGDSAAETISAIKDQFALFGIVIEVFGPSRVIIREAPSCFHECYTLDNWRELLQGWLHSAPMNINLQIQRFGQFIEVPQQVYLQANWQKSLLARLADYESDLPGIRYINFA